MDIFIETFPDVIFKIKIPTTKHFLVLKFVQFAMLCVILIYKLTAVAADIEEALAGEVGYLDVPGRKLGSKVIGSMGYNLLIISHL